MSEHHRIRVAHFISSLQIGGAENQVALTLGNLDPTRFEPHLITFKKADCGFESMLPDRVQVHCIDYRRRNAPASLYRLYDILKSNEIDVLHCHMYHAGLFGSVIGRAASVGATVTSEHGKNTWKTWWHHTIERHIVSPLVSGRVAVSEDIRQIRIDTGDASAESVIVIPNAVDTDVRVADNKGPVVRLGALGRLVDAKDYGNLLAALRLLRSNGSELTLEIAGEGEERSRLTALIAEQGLGDCARLVGNQSTGDFLSSIDLFVMSSKREGIPVALLEAMAHGLPIVATQAGGIPEVITHGQEGLLCPIESAPKLAEQITIMAQDEKLRCRLGANARETVVERYGIGSVVQHWEQLYTRILSEKKEALV